MNLRQKNKKLKKEIERLKGMTKPIKYIEQRHDIREYCVERKFMLEDLDRMGVDKLNEITSRGFIDVLPNIATFESFVAPGGGPFNFDGVTVRATIKFVVPEGRGLYD